MVSGKPPWAKASDQYVKPPGSAKPKPEGPLVTPPVLRDADDQRQWEDTGVVWDEFSVESIQPSAVERARQRFRAHLPELIWNTAALEGNNFTLPEVQTLLEGVTVGGRKLEDEQQILALSEAYRRLDELVASGRFALSKSVSDELHGMLARHEAIEAGHFRGEGRAVGGGTVRLSGGGVVVGTEHGKDGELLHRHFDNLIHHLRATPDPRLRALVYFASATRRQFYFDGNKRTARLMMAGELISSGYDVVSVPFSRKLEFNIALDTMFDQDDATVLLRFLGTCPLLD